MNTPEDTLDLMRDEFMRIAANYKATDEIKSLCRRAISDVTVSVPIIAARDNAEREAKIWETRYNEQTLVAAAALKELGELRELIDAASDIIEIWTPQSSSQSEWKEKWLYRVRGW